MKFIKAYVKTKCIAARYMFHAIKCTWDERNWGMAIMGTLWAMICIVCGLAIEPITLIANAILWKKTPDAEKFINEFMDAFVID